MLILGQTAGESEETGWVFAGKGGQCPEGLCAQEDGQSLAATAGSCPRLFTPKEGNSHAH